MKYDTSALVGLRRALMGVMTYAFARIGAAVAIGSVHDSPEPEADRQ
jgi:hypothetical protein